MLFIDILQSSFKRDRNQKLAYIYIYMRSAELALGNKLFQHIFVESWKLGGLDLRDTVLEPDGLAVKSLNGSSSVLNTQSRCILNCTLDL